MVIIKDLEKHYGSFHLNVSMEIPDGRITGMIGKNGAGKTTTIKAILGLIRPDGGSVEVFGKNINELTHTEKERISAALAESGFSGWLYVEDAAKILRSLYSRFDEGMFLEYCRILNLPLKKQIKEFSMGMKAKLRVLCALCTGADLMIMDEPTAGLDVEARIEILELIQKYMEAHPDASVLISSHISSDLEGLCDDIYLIHDGKILLHEDTDVILDNYGVLKCDEDLYSKLDKQYILSTVQDKYMYRCLCSDRQYYSSLYPDAVVEKAGLDDLILMMGGKGV